METIHQTLVSGRNKEIPWNMWMAKSWSRNRQPKIFLWCTHLSFELSSDWEIYLHFRGILLQDQKRTEEAVESYKRAIQYRPKLSSKPLLSETRHKALTIKVQNSQKFSHEILFSKTLEQIWRFMDSITKTFENRFSICQK